MGFVPDAILRGHVQAKAFFQFVQTQSFELGLEFANTVFEARVDERSL
jgi:hypothetical protein